MNDESFRLYFQVMQQQIAALQNNEADAWEEVNAAIEDLYVAYEQMQTNLEAAEVFEEELIQQNEQLAESFHYFYDLYQSSPIASLVTDANGLILEGNLAIARLLNVPHTYLIGKPLAVYIAESDRPNFRTKLNQLSQRCALQSWQTTFCPREGNPFAVELQIDVACNASGEIENLRIGVFALARSPQIVAQKIEAEIKMPRSLDGLRVLVVDDEADVREFITAILEPYGIGVRAVASAMAALEELERFRPDVLVSDIRMAGGDGYRLIQQIRALEAEQGTHIPAAAITAHLDEDREKALNAGFEAHLHKLAQPIELVQMVAQLAGRTAS
ncbi:MAG: response regulator [Plectolyngbya sp. WJT66-NPBG17]|jgi:PAS domain S-box-containing protein|nr:response regulator [Plectolyngbya sp. WJT66-NPBG17]